MVLIDMLFLSRVRVNYDFIAAIKKQGAEYGHLMRSTSASVEMETGYITTKKKKRSVVLAL